MKKHHAIALGALIIVIILVIGVVLLVNRPASAPASNTTTTNQGTTSMQLQKTDEVVGTGAEAVDGKSISVSYTGTLADGTVFDSTSKDGGQPFTFTLGAGQVIKGWDEGVVGMKVGGTRKLVIPPSLGYGDQATGSIPPNSTLTFVIQLLSVN
jgi:peptidylprolyl isomerase/FKBP-type peptidyl-prolyl cis-trans isomerase FkpA